MSPSDWIEIRVDQATGAAPRTTERMTVPSDVPEGSGDDLADEATRRSFAFERLGASAAILDGTGTIVDTNEAWRLFGRLNGGSPGEAGVGAHYLTACDRAAAAGSTTAAAVASGLRQVLSGERLRFDVEYPCPSPAEDRWYRLEASAAPISNSAGAVLLHIDITSLRALLERLAAHANHDGLTGLPNRRSALAHLSDLLADGSSVSVLFLDLDGFKEVNDLHGHHAGDELLVKVASRLQRAVGDAGYVTRIGGDEFLIIGGGPLWDPAGAQQVAATIRDAIERPFQVGAQLVSITVSIGVATNDEDGDGDGDRIVQAADSQMYVDKERRRSDRRLDEASEPAPSHPVPTPPSAATGAEVPRTQAKAEAVLAHPSDLVLFFDSQGTIDWVSPSVLETFGVDAASVVGRNGIEIIHPDDRERVVNEHMSIPNRGDHVLTEFRIVLGGRVRWVEEVATYLSDEPDVRRMVGNLRVVTERKGAADSPAPGRRREPR